MTKKKKEEITSSEKMLSEREIEDLFKSLQGVDLRGYKAFEDANTRECVISNMYRIKTAEDIYDVVLGFVKERQWSREEIKKLHKEKEGLKNDIKMFSRLFSKTFDIKKG